MFTVDPPQPHTNVSQSGQSCLLSQKQYNYCPTATQCQLNNVLVVTISTLTTDAGWYLHIVERDLNILLPVGVKLTTDKVT